VPRFPEHFVHQVQQATDIVDLVSQYVALKRRGREFLGLCPFHQDKKPSLNVSPSKQIFKCFACGAGGSAFNFVMLYDQVAFPEAVRMLADRANIPLPETTGQSAPPGGVGRSDLAGAMTFAMDFYRKSLRTPAGANALEYARQRELSEESLERFGVGYAPEAWDSLLLAARRAGFGEKQLVAAGLAVRRESGTGCYDRFRNRLMFPIIDAGGRVVAFGGRALSEQDRAKYLNSAESPLFDKSRQLFGLNWSREGIVSSGQAIVAEGYLDVLIPLQAGVANIVATLGTSLTEGHVRLLSRYASDVVLLFDADTAGAAAADRAMELFLAQQVRVRVATIPAGKDPCDYCLAEGGDALRTLVDSAPDALQYAWDRRRTQLEQAGSNLADRRRVVEDFLRLIASSSAYGAIDEVRKGQLAQHIGHLLNIPQASLQEMMRRLTRRQRAQTSAAEPTQATSSPEAGKLTGLVERQILEVLVNRPDLFDVAAERLTPRDFEVEPLRRIAEVLWSLCAAGREGLDDLLSSEELADLGGLVAHLATEGERRGNHEGTLDGAIEALLRRRGVRELEALKAAGYQDDETLRRIQRTLRGDPNQPRRRPMIR
jgi:DNA primase